MTPEEHERYFALTFSAPGGFATRQAEDAFEAAVKKYIWHRTADGWPRESIAGCLADWARDLALNTDGVDRLISVGPACDWCCAPECDHCGPMVRQEG